ncbi:uncharacterized protein LY79DRAFT_566032 [Colletotrichum navitas]|uniref:Uncharacterized protein n=1 Tax=Colletotrichum navitas TaxID=681940 RepID=A0AAD8PQN4_9PEZI|nr:uncharacterized protein LY79DRAFT_566032 [Colletotrichum navitas]KAK1574486.1 hypothetical protein LY79DRAFT_566032 [Colletotrichum navitas]
MKILQRASLPASGLFFWPYRCVCICMNIWIYTEYNIRIQICFSFPSCISVTAAAARSDP